MVPIVGRQINDMLVKRSIWWSWTQATNTLDSKHNIDYDYIIGEKSKNYNTSTSPNARVYKRVNYDPLPLGKTTTHFVNLDYMKDYTTSNTKLHRDLKLHG